MCCFTNDCWSCCQSQDFFWRNLSVRWSFSFF